MNFTEWQRVRVIAYATLVSSLFVVTLFSLALHASWNARSDTLIDSAIDMDKFMQKDFEILRSLNSEDSNTCSNQLLTRMRLAEVRSAHLFEYGMVKDNKLICTTVLGNLEIPTELAPIQIKGSTGIDFISSAKVHSTQDKRTAMLVKIGSFRALIRMKEISEGQNPWIKTGIFSVNSGEHYHVYGESKIRSRKLPSLEERHHWIENGRWVSQQCYSNTTCGVVSVHLLSFFKSELTITTILMTFLILTISLSVYFALQLHTQHVSISKQLLRGLTENRIVCLFQPIMSLTNRKFESCEVLCRWIDENDKMLTPDAFLNEIENNNQSHELTRIVMSKSIHELNTIGLLGKVNFAINAFPEDITSGHAEQLADKLLPREIRKTVTFEVTEKEVVNVSQMAKKISNLREKQVKVSIDDFGTGYSNFQHLEKLHVDLIKIDRSFIKGIESNTVRSTLVQRIVEIANDLELNTVAEGVEKIEQLEELKRLGIGFSQGFYHAKPMSIIEYDDFIKSQTS